MDFKYTIVMHETTRNSFWRCLTAQAISHQPWAIVKKETQIMLPENFHRAAKQVVASIPFQGAQGGRRDLIMIEGSAGSDNRNAERFFPLWFGKAMLFIPILLFSAF